MKKYMSLLCGLLLFIFGCTQPEDAFSMHADDKEFPVQTQFYPSHSLPGFFKDLSVEHTKRGEEYLAKVYANAATYTGLPTCRTGEADGGDPRSLEARMKASIYGATIGDAMGFLVEATPMEKIQEYFPEGLTSFYSIATQTSNAHSPGHKKFVDHTLDGGHRWKTSDDTFFSEIVLRVALQAKREDWSTERAMQELGQEFAKVDVNTVNGVGNAMVDACKKLQAICADPQLMSGGWWKRGAYYFAVQERIAQQREGGSGGAMRAWPMGIVFWNDEQKAAEWGALQSYLSHADPAAIGSSAAIAAGVASALQLKPREEVITDMFKAARKWEAIARDVPEEDSPSEAASLIDRAFQARHKTSIEFVGSLATGGFQSKEAVAAAAHIFAQDPDNVMKAIYASVHNAGPGSGRDNDTIATLAAALVGAHAGLDTLPQSWIGRTQMSDKLIPLAQEAADSARI